MSFESDDSNEIWSKVVSKSRRRKTFPAFSCSEGTRVNSCQCSIAEVKQKVTAAEEELQSSIFYSSFLVTLNSSLGQVSSSCIKEIVCYGIGSIAESVTSRFQLGLVLLLRKRLQTSVFLYDPIFSDFDRSLLKEFDCQVITENDEAKRKVNHETLIVFPHVPKELIDNFLQANWCQNLSKCFLLCNSFSKISEDNTNSVLKTNFAHLYRAFDCYSEFKIANNFRFKDIFNDLSIHTFPTLLEVDY